MAAWRKCELDDCRLEFDPRRKNMIFCSTNCAKKHSNRRKRAKYQDDKETDKGYQGRKRKEYICQYRECKKSFLSAFYNAKYCCRKCSDRERYEKDQDRLNPDRKIYLGKLGTQKMQYVNPKFSTQWMQDGWDRVKHEYGY